MHTAGQKITLRAVDIFLLLLNRMTESCDFQHIITSKLVLKSGQLISNCDISARKNDFFYTRYKSIFHFRLNDHLNCERMKLKMKKWTVGISHIIRYGFGCSSPIVIILLFSPPSASEAMTDVSGDDVPIKIQTQIFSFALHFALNFMQK